jgi:hypothetical protein
LTRRQPIWPSFHKQPEHIEAVVLRKRGKRRNGIDLFHVSTNTEQSGFGQGLFQPILKYCQSLNDNGTVRCSNNPRELRSENAARLRIDAF